MINDIVERLDLSALEKRYGSMGQPAYPKAKQAGTDLNRDILWNAVSPHGLSGVALVSLNDVWSAMRFRPSERVGR